MQFKAGANGEKTKDDTSCTACSDGTYKPGTSGSTTCTAKHTASNNSCSTIQKFVPGRDSETTTDDSKCVTCSDGQYRYNALNCAAKRTASNKGCSASQRFVPGSNSEKTRDDTTCATCSATWYKNSATTCTRKRKSCGAGQKFKAGINSEKTTDDTTCTACSDGTYKNSATTCARKLTSCGAGETFTAGSNSEKTKDDTTCTICADGTYKNSATGCTPKTMSSDCSSGQKFEVGDDSVKNQDDSHCTLCTAPLSPVYAPLKVQPLAPSSPVHAPLLSFVSLCPPMSPNVSPLNAHFLFYEVVSVPRLTCILKYSYSYAMCVLPCKHRKLLEALFTLTLLRKTQLEWATGNDGEYKNGGTTCTAKTAACGAGFYYTAGKDRVKSVDDVVCSACPSGRYTTGASTATACTAKQTAVDCTLRHRGEQFSAGNDSEKRRDDTRCEKDPCGNDAYGASVHFGPAQLEAGTSSNTSNTTQFASSTTYTCVTCSDGQYKNSSTSCTPKATACATGEAFTAGNDFEKTKDDTACIASGSPTGTCALIAY